MSFRSALVSFVNKLRDPGNALETRDGGSLNNPSVPLSAAGFLSWAMGAEPTASGEQVTLNSSLAHSTVYACARVLATSTSSMPCYVFEVTDNDRKRAVDHQVDYLLSCEPNDEMTSVTFIECIMVALALAGNSYSEIQRDIGGRAVALWPLHPQLTEPMRATNGDLVYETTDGMASGQKRRIASADMLHIPLFSFNGLKGFSPIHQARQGIGLAKATEKYGARFFGNGARPSGVLTNSGTLTDKQKQEARETWKQVQGGENQGSTAVLAGNWDYKQIGISPEDSQFLATRVFQRADIAQGIYGIPPHMVGDTGRLSNNNAEQQALSFVTDTLRPYLTKIEAECRRKLFPKVGRTANRYVVQFDVSERLRGDFKTTMDGYAVGKQWGFYNTNMVLRDLGKNPIGPEGDIFWAPVNMQNAAWLLETESIQDQPIGADPNDPVDDEGDEGPKTPAPTKKERSLMNRFIRGYIPVFRDAFGRLLKRDKRDSEAIAALLGPVFRSIAASSMEQSGSAETVSDQLIADLVRAIEKRAARWPAQLDETVANDLAQGEFIKAVRSIHINVARELAADRASEQLALTEGA